MPPSAARLAVTTMRLPNPKLGPREYYQLWLIIGDRNIQVGPACTNRDDVQALATLLWRAFPDLEYEEINP